MEIRENNRLIKVDEEKVCEFREIEGKSRKLVYWANEIPCNLGNAFNMIHGGALSSYIDIVTTAGIYTFDLLSRG